MPLKFDSNFLAQFLRQARTDRYNLIIKSEMDHLRGYSLWFFDVDINFVTGRLRHRASLRGEEASPANRKHTSQITGSRILLFRRGGIAPERTLVRQMLPGPLQIAARTILQESLQQRSRI